MVAHPNGGVKEQVAGLHAQRLAEKGYITITADAAYQGASGGQPRNVDKPAFRIEDIHGMADFITRYPGADVARLGLLGICGGGGYSLAAAQTDKRFKSIATLSMFNPDGFVATAMWIRNWRPSRTACSRLRTPAPRRAAGGEILYAGDANLTPTSRSPNCRLICIGRVTVYYWKTHAHPGSTFKYTSEQLAGPDALGCHRPDRTDENLEDEMASLLGRPKPPA